MPFPMAAAPNLQPDSCSEGFGMEFKAHMNKGLSGDLKVAISIPPNNRHIFLYAAHCYCK